MAKKEFKETVSKEKDTQFVDHVVSVRRVTKVTKGGKRFSFSAFVISGNKQGQVGVAIGKSKEATLAIAKATNKARKNMITVPLRGATIPYGVTGKHGAAKVVLLPASKGTGKIAGGAVRSIIDAIGIEDTLTKSLGSANQINVAKATLNAISKLRSVEKLAKMRGFESVKNMVKGA
jgi:small subunit ribosomal protein S5